MAKGERRTFGQITKLPQGNYRARYADPEGRLTASGEPVRHSPGHTFETRQDAEAWLAAERRSVSEGTWTSPAQRKAERQTTGVTLGDYAPRWLDARKVKGRPLAERTRDHYAMLLRRFILPRFGQTRLRDITPEDVAHWYDTSAVGTPTQQAHAYALLRSILATAADPTKNAGRPLIPFNPCGITGAGVTGRRRQVRPASAEEVATIAENVPERHRLLVLLADGCGLRYGELAELRRGDVDTKQGVLRVRRGVARGSEGAVVRPPKSAAGVRDVPVPPHLLPALREHLLEHAAPGHDGLLFPARDGSNMSPSTFYGRPAKVASDGRILRRGYGWHEARRIAGREDLTFHGLRHGALTEAARNGATLAELMALAGHSTSQAALRYQHSASDRLAELARKRSEAVGWSETGGAQ